jgi:hypothetical protein
VARGRAAYHAGAADAAGVLFAAGARDRVAVPWVAGHAGARGADARPRRRGGDGLANCTSRATATDSARAAETGEIDGRLARIAALGRQIWPAVACWNRARPLAGSASPVSAGIIHGDLFVDNVLYDDPAR